MLEVAIEKKHVGVGPAEDRLESGPDGRALSEVGRVPQHLGAGLASAVRRTVRRSVVDDDHVIDVGPDLPNYVADRGDSLKAAMSANTLMSRALGRPIPRQDALQGSILRILHRDEHSASAASPEQRAIRSWVRSSESNRWAWNTSAAALESRGHQVTLRDLRFSPPVETILETVRPDLVGVACMHALEIDDVRDVVSRIRNARPKTFLIVGGHSAAAYPAPFFDASVDGICLDDGERAVPELVDALAAHKPARRGSGLDFSSRQRHTSFTGPRGHPFSLDDVPLPARHLVSGWRRRMRACTIARPT